MRKRSLGHAAFVPPKSLGLAVLWMCVTATAQTQVIQIWPGVAPGSENWTQAEGAIKGSDGEDRTVNVVTPTLTVYLPEKGKATGAGVLIAPGGGFVHLAIHNEGYRVASWLQERGIAAFVLKYRLRQRTPEELQGGSSRAPGGGAAGRPAAARSADTSSAAPGRAPAGPGRGGMDNAGQYGIADGIQALTVLRRRAQEWGLAPDKIGMVGFSAGGMVTSGVLLQEDAAARPAFAGLIYGAPFGALPAVPQELPPVFLAWAQDDRTAGAACGRFHEALKAAGSAPEVHIYKSGGHGFGTSKQGTTSDHWMEEFYHWLQAQGFARP
ncbi:MAG: dienelactone hydrolase family protein [Phycisphaerae bacterium]|nr:dienelactone hydrolase family protein [Phycisphaerae bacterium]